MKKSSPIRDRHLQSLFRPNRGGKGKPVKARTSRDYGRGLINDHIRDDVRPDHFLHAHARRRRASFKENPDAR